MAWFQPCICFRSDDKDNNVYYRASRPTSQDTPVDLRSKPKKKLFWGLKKKSPTSNPQIPQERQHFNPSNIPNIDDPIPTYESVDAVHSENVYSRVNEIPRRYEYPAFNKTRQNEEAVYASASQIYSGGSEDPYSSIVSDIEGRPRGDDNSVGYAMVVDEAVKPCTSRVLPIRSVDSLYSKINRNVVNKKMTESCAYQPEDSDQPVIHSTPSTSMDPNTVVVQHPEPVLDMVYPYNESGSGSITSSGSRNPSYKYLTVRETLGVIRERIRAREEGIIQTPGNGREHYYSTINNDYETVKDPRAPLNVKMETKTNPRPPTSPVPNHIPTMVRSFPCYDEKSATHLVQSHTFHPRPIIISLAGLSRIGGSIPDVNRSQKRSKIPISVYRKDMTRYKSLPPKNLKQDAVLFFARGRDYVSPIDFGTEKGWPFNCT